MIQACYNVGTHCFSKSMPIKNKHGKCKHSLCTPKHIHRAYKHTISHQSMFHSTYKHTFCTPKHISEYIQHSFCTPKHITYYIQAFIFAHQNIQSRRVKFGVYTTQASAYICHSHIIFHILSPSVIGCTQRAGFECHIYLLH